MRDSREGECGENGGGGEPDAHDAARLDRSAEGSLKNR
jgi:hypothetical protein